MTPDRRTYLATLGTVALSGCLGSVADSDSTSSTEATTSGTTTTATTTDGSTTETEDTSTTAESTETTIGFGGDTMVGRTLNDIYGQDDVDPASIWGEFQAELQSVDGVFCNLECSLSTRGERFPDRSFYFRGDPEWAVPALQAGNVAFATLSNNHSMDFGAVALTDTIDVLEEAGIENAGTGHNPAAAWEPATFSVGDLDVAVVSFADEYEVYAASDDRPGIAWARTHPENARTQRLVGNAIEKAQASEPDLLVVSLHWGENWVEIPGDRLRSFGHWLIDQGADLVHGHSAHVVQAIEQYEDGVILHDTGDLVDDFGIKDDLGNDKSYLFEVTISGEHLESIRLVPFHIDHGVRPATDDEAAWLRKTIRDRSAPFETTYEQDGNDLVVTL